MYDYKKNHRRAGLKVGLVITIALTIIFFAVMFAGNIERIFAPRSNIYAVFDDIKGLREGSPVWFAGVEIGSVHSIYFTPQQTIHVEMSIISGNLQYLKANSKADILTLGLLGDKYIEITPGSTDAASLKAGEMIMGTSHIEIQDVVETGQESIASLSEFINTLEDVILRIEAGEGTVKKFLTDPSVYNNLDSATNELTELIKKVKTGKGSLSRLLNEDTVYKDVAASASNIASSSSNIASSAEDIKLFTRKVQTSDGSLNRFIEDESLYENINDVSDKLNSLLARVDRGEGFVGALMKDEEISAELKTTLRELNTLIKDIKDNPTKYFKFSLF
jgi:phospholipid/cholesterol/gamma-HCH transport system substrate-binding protein